MPWSGNNQWRGVVPVQAVGAVVVYWVTATDWSGNLGTGASKTYTVPTPFDPADFDRNGAVNGADLGFLLGAWGPGSGPADLDRNGDVNGADLGRLLGSWSV
jgi:hypothetical protein